MRDVFIYGGRSAQRKKNVCTVMGYGREKRKLIDTSGYFLALIGANISLSNMRKLIKNYTTDIPAERTIAEIQKILAQNGARWIALEYDGQGNIKDIFFKIVLHDKELPFRLPAKANRVYTSLHGDATPSYQERYGKQWKAEGERIAWRICKTWLEAQITLINLEQVKIEEVFLPYLIMPGNKTLFETMERYHFLRHNSLLTILNRKKSGDDFIPALSAILILRMK